MIVLWVLNFTQNNRLKDKNNPQILRQAMIGTRKYYILFYVTFRSLFVQNGCLYFLCFINFQICLFDSTN